MSPYVTTCEIQGPRDALMLGHPDKPDLPAGSPITPEILAGLGYHPNVWQQKLKRGEIVPASSVPAPHAPLARSAPVQATQGELGDRVADILEARRGKEGAAAAPQASRDAFDTRLAALLQHHRRTGAVAPSGQSGDLGDLTVAVLLERRAAGACRAPGA